ncbi:MAG TPA: phenylalanine--tRNA ligase subunit beta [Patescibacteria group bacterium]|nr:phenylalanine--tRNA ligase subunit beta [Patescibacteria group bacterium]
MKISTQAIKFINEHNHSAGDPAPNGVADLVGKIGAQLGAVEETIAFGERFAGALVVRVVSCVDHPDSDHLHICKIDDAHKSQNVERDTDGYVQVVCGAPNVREGLVVVWLPPGATVPETYGSNEPLVLEARPFRGQVSNGMLASSRELGLSDEHDGILEVTQDSDETPIQPGTSFADACHLTGDVIIDMENKMFTHRPDCFGWLGIAREIEGIYGRPYKSPQWYTTHPEFPGMEADELKLEVRNELPELVPRFTAVALSGVEIKQSPLWLQVDLARAGMRPINNIVDYTNYYMLLTGQPLHAYDYDKVKAVSGGDQATVVVRSPQKGEKILLLNGKEIEPRAEAIMIATDKELIGVGGVMGGGDTEVDATTKNIILECASFDMYSIRRTSMAHGLFTDAVTRFNKGQSPLQNLAVLAKITDAIRTHAGGKVASPLIDLNHVSDDSQARGSLHAPVTLTTGFINDRLGINLPASAMQTLLENVEFKVEVSGDQLVVTAPFWRTDIEIPEDIVEEVGRLYGFDHLPMILPVRDIAPAVKNDLLELKGDIRDQLARAGANELLTYSFVHGDLFKKVGQDAGQAFQLSNALSPDLQYFRLSLTPSLLDKVHANIKAGYDEFAVFEINKVHNTTELNEDGVPREVNGLSLVFVRSDKTADPTTGAPYYQARLWLTRLLEHFDTSDLVALEPLEGADLYGNPWLIQMTVPYEPRRSAVLRAASGPARGLIWGVVGEFKPSVRRSLKLPKTVAGFEVDPLIFAKTVPSMRYQPLPRFPAVTQDICLKVPAETTYAEVYDFVEGHLARNRPDQTHHTLTPVDIYQREDDQAHKQITLHLSLASFERTLTDQEVNKLLDSVAAAAATALHAERI